MHQQVCVLRLACGTRPAATRPVRKPDFQTRPLADLLLLVQPVRGTARCLGLAQPAQRQDANRGGSLADVRDLDLVHEARDGGLHDVLDQVDDGSKQVRVDLRPELRDGPVEPLGRLAAVGAVHPVEALRSLHVVEDVGPDAGDGPPPGDAAGHGGEDG